MQRRFVNQLGEQEMIHQVFRANEKQLRRTATAISTCNWSFPIGADRSVRMWNTSEALFRSFDNGDYILVEGTSQLFQGAVQVIISRLTKVEPSEVNEDDFRPLATRDVDHLVVRLGELLRSITHPHLRNLADCFLLDEEFMAKFTRAPAGVKHHHAYLGGLLEHVVNLMDVVTRIAPCYPQINRDLLLMGAFLHDVSKIDELTYDRELTYSDEGQLIGHLVMAVGLLEGKVHEAEKLSGELFPRELVLRLKHVIVSHHGEYEYGSPKLPMTLEAVALYCLDNLDAKVAAFSQQMRDDPNVGSPWTNFNAVLGRKLYKGSGWDE